jgi:glycosyltransferase-like protein LARGE
LPSDTAKGKNHQSLEISKFPSEIINWAPSEFTAKHMELEYLNVTPISMSEDLFLSKAFSQSMRPSKIVPFFYRATGEFNKEDITLTTLVTSSRFKVFSQLVEIYQGASIILGHIIPHISYR